MKSHLLAGTRFIVAGVFFVAGVMKLLDPAGFRDDIAATTGLSWPIAEVTATYLPWLEVATAIAMLLPTSRKVAVCAASGLLVLFSAVLMRAQFLGLDAPCGCFGLGWDLGWAWQLARNAVLLVALAPACMQAWYAEKSA